MAAGEAVTLSGRLSCEGTTIPAGETITVYQRQRGAGATLAEAGTASTDSEGDYGLTTAPLTADSVFVVRATGAHQARAVVDVTPVLTLDGPATAGTQLAERAAVGRGIRNRFTFSGSVAPASSGARVALQRRYLATGERWHTIAFGLLDEEGRFSISRGFHRPGEVSVRAVVHLRGEGSYSTEPLTYDIVQVQSPLLTIQAAADPDVSGQPTTISGTAGGPVGQALTLLARSAGAHFVTVASGTSQAGGAYSFEVTPLRNTVYRVRSASASSSELFVGVTYALALPSAPSAVAVGEQATFSGTVAPAPAGQIVHLEAESGSGTPAGIHYRVLATGSVGQGSSYSIQYAFHRPGSYRVRIAVPPGLEMLGARSEPFELTVTPAESE
ncbi:MAG: hypothetical protein ACLQBB_08655 [Solirubrobacteraceae bacterium]